MSPHDIAAPPDQSSPNSGNRFQMGRVPTLPKCIISATKNFWPLPPTGRRKVGQSSPHLGNNCQLARSLMLPNFVCSDKVCHIHFQICFVPVGKEKLDQSSLKAKRCMRNVLQKIFLPTCEFWRPRGPLGPKFTNFRIDAQQGPIYFRCGKFRPVLTTCVRDIWCQTSWISLTAWLTNKRT